MKMIKGDFTVHQVGNESQIMCEGDFTFKNATVIREILSESTARSGAEVLCLKNATAIDVTGIQLACSWKKTLSSQGRAAQVVLPDSETLTDLLIKTGIAKLF